MEANTFLPANQVIGLSQQLTAAGIEESVVESLIKSSYTIDFKKGDTFRPCQEDALLLYFRSGCMVEVLTLSDDQPHSSTLWTAGYITVALPSELNRFENNSSYYVCLFDAEITVIPKFSFYRQASGSPSLLKYVLSRASECLFTGRDLALLRSKLDKRDNIALRLIVLYIRTEGHKLFITIDELCQLTSTTRQYCSKIIKQFQQAGILEKKYGCISILDDKKLMEQVDDRVLDFVGNYMPLVKER